MGEPAGRDLRDDDGGDLGAGALVALATGGMVGGGIYVALGVVVETAGRWAWLAFLVAGVIAVTTAHVYGRLTTHFETGGGSFGFLERLDRRNAAGSLSWIMLGAYVLTIALYGYAFGQYVSNAFGLSTPAPRLLSVAALAVLVGLNLLGIGKLKLVEIVIVAVNLFALLVLAAVGLADWQPDRLVAPNGPLPITAAGMGAAVIFVSYEGFQLLTYDYDEVRDPDRVLTPSLTWSAVAVVGIYVLVGVGATMIMGAATAIDRADVALAVAAQQAAGTTGLVAMTVAAAFATSAAINATLFSSAKLARRVSDDGELPAWLDHRNGHGVPDRAIVVLGGLAAVLAATGSLSALVEAASLVFLVAFGIVHAIAWRERAAARWTSVVAITLGGVVGVHLVVRLATTKPIALGIILALFAVGIWGRPAVLRHLHTENAAADGSR